MTLSDLATFSKRQSYVVEKLSWKKMHARNDKLTISFYASFTPVYQSYKQRRRWFTVLCFSWCIRCKLSSPLQSSAVCWRYNIVNFVFNCQDRIGLVSPAVLFTTSTWPHLRCDVGLCATVSCYDGALHYIV